MKIVIQTPGFKAQPKLLKHVKNNVEKLAVLSDRILEAQVCLTITKSSTQENKVCEIKLVIPGNDLFASKQTETFEQSVTEAYAALRHQIEKWKTVRSNTAQRGTKHPLTADEAI